VGNSGDQSKRSQDGRNRKYKKEKRNKERELEEKEKEDKEKLYDRYKESSKRMGDMKRGKRSSKIGS